MMPGHTSMGGRAVTNMPKQQTHGGAPPAVDAMMTGAAMYAGGMQYPVQVEMKPQDYGLLGILPVIRAPAKESGPLAYGVELTHLFPTISIPEPVHSTFAGPWATAPIKREPEFQIPPAYLVSPPPKIADKIDLFSDDTLFYIFYTMPKDAMQLQAARTLAKREWMYHKELKMWLKRAEILSKTNSSETGAFVFMDTTRWEEVRKEGFTLEYDKLERSY